MKENFFLTVVVVCLFSVVIAAAQTNFRLDESATKVFVKPENLQINLAFENKSKKFPAKIRLEILDANDEILAQIETRETIKRGKEMVANLLPFDYAAKADDYLWLRLRYSIAPDEATDNRAVNGIVSLSEITPDIFELRAFAGERILSGTNYRIRTRAFQPVTTAPMPDVKIAGELSLELKNATDKLKLEASSVTDRDGFATLDFTIPANANLDDGEVKISGARNGIERETEKDLYASGNDNSIYLNTDKPLYQPNQMLRVRGLFLQNGNLDSATKALGDRALEFIVKDEDNTILYRETTKTSRFGIAAINWQIPENAKLGTYRVVVEADEDLEINQIYFKVSRYDLPNFTVAAKAEKSFYLPDETTAKIVVSADYLFGKPVAKGKVKVVQEKSREWNYKEQKWEIEEEKQYEGETDADGKFVAQADLTEAHADLKEAEYRRFEDVHFAAYFTDATTNRTEQRRFDVRITKDAIHVYLVKINSYDDQNPKLPIRFYVSTFYADGAPANCQITIEGKYEDEEKFKLLARAKTNLFGAGKIVFSAPKRADDIYVDDLQIKVNASEADGKKGIQEDEISIDEDAKKIQISTDKTIYRTGEPIKIHLVSTENDRDVFVDVTRNQTVVKSQIVRLKNGRGDLKISYDPAFANALTVAAYIDDGGDEIDDSRGVIYPRPTNLRLDAAPVQNTYRPNEEAKVNFTISFANRKAEESALGVIVFDKAIEERARADADFGGANVNQFGDYYRLLDNDLSQMILTEPVSEDLQLKAEIALADSHFSPVFFQSDEYDTNLKNVFASYLAKQFKPIQNTLENTYAKDFTHPIDDASLRKILAANRIDFDELRDPWGNVYRTVFSIEREQDVVSIKSAGANKKFDDADDFTILELKFKYFTPIGEAIDRAVFDYHKATKNFIRDYATLREELKKQNIDLDNLRDCWNNPYRIEFGVEDKRFTIEFRSGGSDGKFDDLYNNFSVWKNEIYYFAETESRIQAILSNYAGEQKSFPADKNEFKEILKNGGVDFDALRDGWNRSLDLKFSVSSRYADKVKTESSATFGEPSKQITTVVPVTQNIAVFCLKSAGADGVFDNADDVTLTTFSGIVSEQSKADDKPVPQKVETVFTGGKGAIRGKIIDATGAFISGAKITATDERTSAIFETETDENGIYILKNLPSGKYTIQAEAAGFSVSRVQNAPVRSSNLTELNFTLSVAGVQTVVEVTAADNLTDTTSANLSESQIEELPINGRRLSQSYVKVVTKSGTSDDKAATVIEEKSTPRLREYFPETLVWQPEIITDQDGKAELKFKLGDNLTTWKLYAIASNTEGKIGVAEKEIKTFQPFFADLEPPKFLTVGDEISLPVPIRNYTGAKQNVNVRMANADWFDLLGSANQTLEVAPNNSANAIFQFKAKAIVNGDKQRVTAIAGQDSDAIEKVVTVRPNGREIVRTQSEIFRETVSFDANFPANSLPEARKIELKIYPNLLAHVAESVEGLLKRPYGCGEQTVSSTYPNLMILKFTAPDNKLRPAAEKFLRQGYERLLAYQHADGGFSVWTKDAPDVALTAYALRFLTDAKDFIEVDESVIKAAQNWLIKQQRTDGSWTRIYNFEKIEDAARTKLMTTYTARTLAMIEKNEREKSAEAQKSLQAALAYLKARNAEIDEPYALALFGLAAFDAGNFDDAKAISARLESMAIQENSGAYWNLETNTPFYGWGTAGRIETTALVVQLLLKVEGQAKFQIPDSKFQIENQEPKAVIEGQMTNDKVRTTNLISKGTQFLLKNKDQFGVWYSTQTTVNVLDAFLAAIKIGEAKLPNENHTAEVFVNDQKLKIVALPPENALAFPIIVDVPATANANRIAIKIGGNQSSLMAQLVQTHFINWQNSEANGREKNQSRALRFNYDCDKYEAKLTEEITCRVEAERVGFKGYGMLLAEIGLPPGAEVDRAALEKAKEENWNFSRYEVLPDKIIVYLWAQAGGAKFDFKFRPRYGINAQTAPSVVYDYYNSEARVTLPPLQFLVK